MRACCLQNLCLLLGSLSAALVVFLLLYFGVIVPPFVGLIVFYSLAAAAGGLGLLAFTVGILLAQRSPALADAWRCCGDRAAFGAAGSLLVGLLSLLAIPYSLLSLVGAALCWGFLILFAGGLLCFLWRYLAARFCCCE